jgi:predicted O-linked N-acetylglucosamine transferase (SPINDLY family)
VTSDKQKTSIQELMDAGQALYDKNEFVEAIKLYKTALIMKKNLENNILGSLYIKLANAYYKIDDKDKYTYYYEEYLKLYPQGQMSVFSRLAHAYYYLDSDKSVDYHNKALNVEQNQYDSACKLFAMTKSSFYSQQDIKEESEYEAENIKNTLYKNITKYNHDEKKKNPDKKLNIGYLSSDCHAHTMMNYILPIWENHNKDEFNFFIFNGSEKDDTTTQRIKKIGFEIIDVSKADNKKIAELIYEKQIDILIDLGGYTHLKSYSFFYKPAPIIISYLGYLNTLGIKEVDYILTDKFTIPEDKAYLYTEKPLYLGKGYQIFMEKSFPEVEENPFKKNEYITFGSFNCTSKFNETTIYLWSKILEGLPSSKLLIYRTRLTKNIIKNLKLKFKQLGIDDERIIYSAQKYNPHFKAYSLCDIALDTYPFSGMSIAIETASMGVPTITMLGDGMQSRGAGRINHTLGLDEFNATYGEEYIKKAIDLANNTELLEKLRKELRDKVNNSDLRQNEVEFTRNLEEKFKEIWKNFINS